MWQGFCHSKVISYKNVPSKNSLSPVKLPSSFAIFPPTSFLWCGGIWTRGFWTRDVLSYTAQGCLTQPSAVLHSPTRAASNCGPKKYTQVCSLMFAYTLSSLRLCMYSMYACLYSMSVCTMNVLCMYMGWCYAYVHFCIYTCIYIYTNRHSPTSVHWWYICVAQPGEFYFHAWMNAGLRKTAQIATQPWAVLHRPSRTASSCWPKKKRLKQPSLGQRKPGPHAEARRWWRKGTFTHERLYACASMLCVFVCMYVCM